MAIFFVFGSLFELCTVILKPLTSFANGIQTVVKSLSNAFTYTKSGCRRGGA